MYNRIIAIALLLIFSVCLPVFASDVGFYVIYPDGEGDSESAKPYLANLYEYLGEATSLTLNGEYINDAEEAVDVLKQNKVQLAIVSPEFFDANESKFQFKKVLKTIPLYSTGPYERYYIMADKSTDIEALMDQKVSVNLFASKQYEDGFLDNKVFLGNDEIKKIPWRLQPTDDILDAINKIAEGKANTFVFLTGYEFSVVNKLKNSNSSFSKLRLVYTSKELPSAVIVTVGKANVDGLDKIKTTLLGMAASLKGNLVLKNLRLKGFADL